MAKVKKNKKNSPVISDNDTWQNPSNSDQINQEKPFWYRCWPACLIFVWPLLIYLNSLHGGYVLDDAIVISQNQYTQQGISGLPGIFSNDSFYGFFKAEGKAHLVEGGRYRPLSMAMFAIEHQLFGDQPFIHHLVGVLLYCFLCLVLFKYLRSLLEIRFGEKIALSVSLFTVMLFAAHPIHTEVVANIKGRDEVLTMLLGILAAWYLYLSVAKSSIKLLIAAAGFFFLSLLAKENGLVFIILAPLALWFFTKFPMQRILKHSSIFVFPLALYILIRVSVLGFNQSNSPILEILNNPFLQWNGASFVPISFNDKLGTILVTFGRYLYLMVWPTHLSHDYYPLSIPLTQWSKPQALLPLLILLTAITSIVLLWKKKSVPIFGMIFFLVALFPMSNLLINVGTLLSERFLFIPSFGFLLIIGWAWAKYISKGHIISMRNILLCFIILSLSFLTIARNKAWKDNFTLFTTDIKNNSQSIKLLASAGGVLTDSASRISDLALRKPQLDQAAEYLNQAISMHPLHKNAYLLLGNNKAFGGNYSEAIKYYQKTLSIDSTFGDAKRNLAISYREVGKTAGEKEQNLLKAKEYLEKSLQINPNDIETIRLYGVCLGFLNKPQEALPYFLQAAKLKPDDANLMFDLGSAYYQAGMSKKGDSLHQVAVKMNPELKKRLK